MIFDVLTLFPDLCRDYCRASLLGRAQQAGLITVRVVDIRDFASDRHRTVDDAPYGGGDGMVMMAPPLVEALESLPAEPPGPVVLLTPRGRVLDQEMVAGFAALQRLVLVCGRYEGVDERVRQLKVDQEVSLGDFVLSGGELAALSVVEAVSRLIPGVLGGSQSAQADSFSDGLLEHPHYTRPAQYRGLGVPEVLLGGNHQAIARWRRKESLRCTLRQRPELLKNARLTPEDDKLLAQVQQEEQTQAPAGGASGRRGPG